MYGLFVMVLLQSHASSSSSGDVKVPRSGVAAWFAGNADQLKT
jgi:hypothetical protein